MSYCITLQFWIDLFCDIQLVCHKRLHCFVQVWTTALKPDSSLLSPQTLSKLSRDEAASVAQLCRLLRLKHAHELDQDTTATVSRLLLALLLHYASSVRRAAVQATKDCLAQKPSLSGQIAAVGFTTSDCLQECHLSGGNFQQPL